MPVFIISAFFSYSLARIIPPPSVFPLPSFCSLPPFLRALYLVPLMVYVLTLFGYMYIKTWL